MSQASLIPNAPSVIPQAVPQLTPFLPQSMNFTKGITGAMNFPAARGSNTPIFDEDEDVFYIKSVDVYGNTKPIRVFDYKERVSEPDQSQTNSNQMTEEIDQLKTDLSDLKEEIAKLTAAMNSAQSSNHNSNSNQRSYNNRKENRNNG